MSAFRSVRGAAPTRDREAAEPEKLFAVTGVRRSRI